MMIPLIVVGLLAFGCADSQQPTCVEQLNKSIAQATVHSILSLKDDIICIEWDSMIIVAPEFNRKQVQDSAKLNLPADIDCNLRDKERYWSILFLSKNKLKGYQRVNQRLINFDEFVKAYPHEWGFSKIPRADAKFKFYVDTNYRYHDTNKIALTAIKATE